MRALRRRVPLIPSRARGFTLMEMIAVIVLLGIVIAIVGGNVMGSFDKSKYKAGTIAAQKLGEQVAQYAMSAGHAPSALQDLLKRDGLGPFAREADLKDPYGHAFAYRAPGEDGRDFEVVFLGKDGKPGGDGMNLDHGHWQ